MLSLHLETSEYVIPGFGEFALTNHWKTELLKYRGSSSFLYWNDLTILKGAFYQNTLREVHHSLNDSYQMNSLNINAKFAIKKSIYENLDKKNLNASISEFYKLNPDKFTLIPNIHRFVPYPDTAYSQVKKRTPTYNAKSVSIIVNYRDRPLLMSEFLTSCNLLNTKKTVELILINNQSTQENLATVKMMCEKIPPGSFKIIHADYNQPFNHSAQSNLGAHLATSEVLLFMNNDARFLAANTLDELADWALEESIATVGPQIIGDNQRLVSAGMEIAIDSRHKQGVAVRESEQFFGSNQLRQTVGNSFACAAISKKNWLRVGPLNEIDYPTQYNDVDFALRCLKKGLNHLYLGYIPIFHEPGASEHRDISRILNLHEKICELNPEMRQWLHFPFQLNKMKSIPLFNKTKWNCFLRLKWMTLLLAQFAKKILK